MEGPPPLRDDSDSCSGDSSASEGLKGWQQALLEGEKMLHFLPDVESSEDGDNIDQGSDQGPNGDISSWGSNDEIISPDRSYLQEASTFALANMRQTQNGLQVCS